MTQVRMPRTESCLHKFPLHVLRLPKETKEASPELSDPAEYCKALFEEMIGRLGIEEKQALWLGLALFKTLSVGTVCAGTDCPIIALKCLAHVAEEMLNPVFGVSGFGVDHMFSAEIDPQKRALLEDINNMGKSYGNVGDLTEDQAPNFKNHGELEPIPSVAFVVGGFPCKDVSFLNKLRAEHKFVVQMAKGKTGSTLAKILEYQRKHGGGTVKMGLYENVVGLASPPKSQSVDGLKFTVHDSNLAATMKALQEVLNQIAFHISG